MDSMRGRKVDLIVDDVLEELDRFQGEFTSLLDSDSPSGTAIKFYFKRILMQFNLLGKYCEYYLINEAFIRSIKYIKGGGKVKNVEAWLKKVGLNVVRELSREQQKVSPLILEDEIPAPDGEVDPEEIESELRKKLQTAHIAFQMLDEFEQEVINLKVTDKLSWKEIANVLKSRNLGDFSTAALRKRKERILKKLRQNYHNLEASGESC